jgi:hypothetical protein
MADSIVRTFEIDTTKSQQNLRQLESAIDAVDVSGQSLKAQLRELQAQLANTDPQTQKYRDLSKAAGELKDKIQDASEAIRTQAGGAFEKVSGSLGLVTSRIASLDFTGAAEGAKLLAQNISDIKPGDIADGIKSIGSAFASVGKALLTNPIFLIGAAIAGAIVYAEELLSLVDGITDAEQKALNVQKERAATAKEQFDLIGQTEQTLKRQGLTEKQITDLKLQQLNSAILEQQVVVETSKQQAAAQIAAAERNAKYLQTFLDFVTFPQRKIAEFFEGFVNGAIDILNKLGLGIEKISITPIFDQVNNFIVKKIFDPEQERKDQEKIVADAEKNLKLLINQRDGLLNEQDAKEKARQKESTKSFADEEKAKTDALLAETRKREQIVQSYYDKLAALQDAQFEATLTDQEKEGLAITKKYEDLFAAADAAGISTNELQKQLADELFALQQKGVADTEAAVTESTTSTLEQIQQGLEWAEKGLNAVNALGDAVFANRMSKVKKGSKEEEALARKQFRFQKALQLGAATIDAAKAITSSLASAPVAIGPVPNPAGIASLALAVTTGAASIAKIAATKFEGGGSGSQDVSVPSFGGGGGADTGTQPAQFNPLAAQFVTNRPDQYLPRAYVLAGDVASQQEIRENVEDLSRIG